jgi:RNA polymerase sigma factor (sigma-70 family)
MRFFLFRSARNTFYDRFRSLKRLFKFQNSQAQEVPEVKDASLKLVLTELIEELPDRQKEVFILRHWHGFSTEETANLTGLNPGTVKSHLSRAIDKLKTGLLATD